MTRNCVAALTLLAATSFAAPLEAFQIQSGFSDPCHETLTLQAARDSFADEFVVAEEVPLPDDDNWEGVSEGVEADLGLEYADERERFLLVSLAIGARWPDTQGHALTDSAAIRRAHVETSDQYNHALRRMQDDFEAGNVAAVEGVRGVILKHLDAAQHYLSLPPDEQLITRQVFVDYYGDIDVELWAPAFHLGFAAHTLQDSFSHAVRSPNLKTILHVMNFTEATRGELEAERDGLAHSGAMDDCENRASKIAASAERATVEMYQAFFRKTYHGDDAAVGMVLDEWLNYEPGCTLENDFCDSPWVTLANEDPAKPLLQSAFGCQTANSRDFALWAMVLAVCAFWYRRRTRRGPGNQDPVAG